MKKNPAHSHILSYLTQVNVFKSIDEIVINQVAKTGEGRATAKLAVYTNLMKLKRNGVLVAIIKQPGIRLWGFATWIDLNGSPFSQHHNAH